jgi:hypothetical protein
VVEQRPLEQLVQEELLGLVVLVKVVFFVALQVLLITPHSLDNESFPVVTDTYNYYRPFDIPPYYSYTL